MSYKSTRIYDFKLLDRLIDFDTLIEHTIEALTDFHLNNIVEVMLEDQIARLRDKLKTVKVVS